LGLKFSQKYIEAKAKLVRSTTKLSHPSAATTTTAKEAEVRRSKGQHTVQTQIANIDSEGK